MRIDIITVVPALLEGPLGHSIIKRARDKGLLEINLHNLRGYTPYGHGQVDDYAFGGGAGMVLMIEPIVNCLEKLQAERAYDEVIYLSPDGELLNQPLVNKMSLLKNLV